VKTMSESTFKSDEKGFDRPISMPAHQDERGTGHVSGPAVSSTHLTLPTTREV